MMAILVTYRWVWVGRRNLEYLYECTWSDGTNSDEFTLPWGRMAGAKEVFK